MSYGVGHRLSSDPTLLWLWSRPVATALIRPLAWEPPYAMEAAQEKAKRQKKKLKQETALIERDHLVFFLIHSTSDPSADTVSSF